MKPTSAQKYDFINVHLAELAKGKKKTVVMEGRTYEVKYIGLENEVFGDLGKVDES